MPHLRLTDGLYIKKEEKKYRLKMATFPIAVL